MKQLIFYTIILLAGLSSCISKEERNHSEVLVKSIIQSVQKNDTAAFHSLFLTESEFIKMGTDGQKKRESNDRALTKTDLHMVWLTMDAKIPACYNELKHLAEAQGINWAKAELVSIDDADRKTQVGVEIWRIKATIKSGEKSFQFEVCDSYLLNDKLKLVQVKRYN